MSEPRIFCIGRNYAAHIRELGSPQDAECLLFMKPASARVAPGQLIRLPRSQGAVHHEAELVVQLSGGGFQIPEANARALVSEVTLGLDLTLRDLQKALREKGAPWERAKAFDGSAPLGTWNPALDLDLQALTFSLTVNGERRQLGHTKDMLFSVARQIHILSQTWSLRAGDILFTGTPEGVGPLVRGDRVDGEIEDVGSVGFRIV